MRSALNDEAEPSPAYRLNVNQSLHP